MIEGARRVLESLQTAGHAPRSGEELSSQLGVSRAQIWKHVSALRKRGYSIDGAPGDGYRLVSSPDRLYPEEISRGLATRWLGRTIEHFDETDSTNRVAADLALERLVMHTVIEYLCAATRKRTEAGFPKVHENLANTVRPVTATL